MQPLETVYVETETVACDGGCGPLGHPKVYLNMEGAGHVLCPYCGRDFVLRDDAPASTGH